MTKRPYLCLLLWALLLPLDLSAQVPSPSSEAWDSERALELIARAQQRRLQTHADTGLVNYQADARLYVYFYLDRQDTGERNLVKTDQLALDVLWQAPDQVKQRIVGWRDEKSLPTNIHYHLDHLTVVQENFGDEIRLGDGDEVRGVLHPAAPGAASFYQYRLADSLTLRLPGASEPVRVYELRVRPRDLDQPAFVGSVFVEQRAGDIVRMDFTFTAAAYVDKYLDYINISLDNGLWRGRFWLPNQQRVELRRRIPQLDIPAGSVIRANARISNYRFNQELSLLTFRGPTVVALPRAQREAFPFEEELHAEVREEGLGPQMELAEIRRMAEDLARKEALRRLPGLRLHLPRVSEAVRYNRAEGLALGIGLAASPRAGLRAHVSGGFAFGAEHPFTSLSLETGGPATRVSGTLYVNRSRDLQPSPIASGLLNTLASAFAGEDYTDLYFADGGELSLRHRLSSSWSLAAEARIEAQSQARNTTTFSVFDGDFRAAPAVHSTDRSFGTTLSLSRAAPSGTARWWELDAAVEIGAGDFVAPAPGAREERMAFAQPSVEASWGWRWVPARSELRLGSQAGISWGELPLQRLYRLGGRGTIPGYPLRAFAGDHFATARATLSADVWRPWLRGRAFAALGWSGVGDSGAPALELHALPTTSGVLPSVGIGVGVLHDILRVDLARGLGSNGRWELIVDSHPSFWDFL